MPRIAEPLQRDDSRAGTSLVRAALEQAWKRRPVGEDDTEWEDAWWDDALDSFVTDQTTRDQLRTWANTFR